MLEYRAPLVLAAAVGHTAGVELLPIEVQLDGIGLEVHTLEGYFTVAVQKCLFAIKVYGHRVGGLVGDNLGHGILRQRQEAIRAYDRVFCKRHRIRLLVATSNRILRVNSLCSHKQKK